MKFLAPIILLLVAIGTFVWYVNPTYSNVRELRAEVSTLDDTLDRSQELIALRDTLLSEYNTFSSSDLRRLEHFLPPHVDNVRLILDIDNIAARYGMVLQNVSVERVASEDPTSDEETGDIGTVGLSFRVSSTYENFQRFLMDLEDSLRLVDVTSVDFGVPNESGLTAYDVQLRTYWLR